MLELTDCWDSLTRSEGKARLYERETWFRESWRDICDVLGHEVPRFLDAAALVLIKPDGLAAGKASVIIDFVEAHGFDLIAVEVPTLTRHHWREMWRYQMTMATLDRLAVNDLVLCDRGLLLALRRRHSGDVPAAVHLTELKGPSDVSRQPAGCLRRLVGQPNRLLSMFHVADEPADLVRELAILLDRPSRRAVLDAYVRRGGLSAAGRQCLEAALGRSAVVTLRMDAAEALARVGAAINLACERGDGTANARRQLRSDLDRMHSGCHIDWLTFVDALQAASIDADRWDVVALGSTYIDYDEAGATRQVEAVDPDAWRGRHRRAVGKASTTSRSTTLGACARSEE